MGGGKAGENAKLMTNDRMIINEGKWGREAGGGAAWGVWCGVFLFIFW